jgi:hypothetical protein
MKNKKILTLAVIALLGASYVSAQTADEIIGKYIQAIGGKAELGKITSLYTESTLDIMGMQGIIKSTTLNGKGMKQEMDIMGNIIATCYTDKGGWSINPMTGSTSAEPMPDAQYNSGKDNIFIGGAFVNYPENGYKAVLLGNEAVGDINAYKIKITLPDSSSSEYFFDPTTFLLVKSIQQVDMQGQMVDNVITLSDYQQTEGYTAPHKMEVSIAGGQFTMTMAVTKVEINVPVDEAIFVKP